MILLLRTTSLSRALTRTICRQPSHEGRQQQSNTVTEGGTHFLRLQIEGTVELADDDLALLQGGGAWWMGEAAADAEWVQRGDERSLQVGLTILQGRLHTLTPLLQAPPTQRGIVVPEENEQM